MIHYTHEIGADTLPAATSMPSLLRCWDDDGVVVTYDVSDVQSVPVDEKSIVATRNQPLPKTVLCNICSPDMQRTKPMTNEKQTTWDRLEMLVCPSCHARLSDCAQGLRCTTCNLIYTVTESIPRMVDESWLDEATSQEMVAQDEHFAGLPDKAVFKPDYHSRYQRRRMRRHLGDLLTDLKQDSTEPLSVHVACCGTGYEVEALLGAGWQVSASDLSVQALYGLSKRSATRGYQVPYLQADVLHLPFGDNSFDVAVAVEGLHHTPDPLKGFCELGRIARRRIAVIEPYSGGLLNALARLGLAHRPEYSGGQARRLTASLIEQMLSVGRLQGTTTRLYLDLPPGPVTDWFGDLPVIEPLLSGFTRLAQGMLRGIRVGNRVLLVADCK